MIATEKLRDEVERTCRTASGLIATVYSELGRTRVFTAAAGLAFYFTFSLVPLLVVFASLLWYLPVTNMVSQLLAILAALIPPDSIQLVQTMVLSVLEPGHAKLLSFS